MRPTHQRLEPGHAPRVQGDERLVVDVELAALQGVVQRGTGLHVVHRVGAHGFVEEHDAGTPEILRAVHGRVGIPEEVVGVRRALGRHRDAQTRGDEDLLIRDRHRLGDRVGDALGDVHDGGGARHVLTQDDELVATEPRDGVARPHGGAKTPGEDLEELVAGDVTEAVVDELESVEIEEDDADLAPVAARPFEGETDAVTEQGPVRQPGEWIVDRGVGQSLCDRLALGDVLDLTDLVERLTVGRPHERHAQRRPDAVPVGMQVALLEPVALDVARDETSHLRAARPAVFRVGDR